MQPAISVSFYTSASDFDEYPEFLGEPGSENRNDIFLVGGILEDIGVLVEEGLMAWLVGVLHVCGFSVVLLRVRIGANS
jgi:hypothetical protein